MKPPRNKSKSSATKALELIAKAQPIAKEIVRGTGKVIAGMAANEPAVGFTKLMNQSLMIMNNPKHKSYRINGKNMHYNEVIKKFGYIPKFTEDPLGNPYKK